MNVNHTHLLSKLDDISQYYISDFLKEPLQKGYGLHSGRSGTVLLEALLYQICDNELEREKLKQRINHNIEYIVRQLELSEHCLPTYCNGLAGIGWLFIYLSERRLFDEDIDYYLADVDAVLLEELQIFLSQEINDYDILHGYLGLGLYFIKRNQRSPVSQILQKLNSTKIEILDGYAWKRFEPYFTQAFQYDFGLAHGNASILYFLKKCHQSGIENELSQQLAEGSLRFFLNSIQNRTVAGSIYPGSIVADKFENGERSSFSRLAWCYGDLGILHTMYGAASHFKLKYIQENILNMFEWETSRTDDGSTNIVDAGFCHGAAGVAYIYLDMYRESHLQSFKDAADYWLEEIIKFGNDYRFDNHGFVFSMGESGFIPNAGLLTGLTGVALVLLNATHPSLDTSWDECFMLS